MDFRYGFKRFAYTPASPHRVHKNAILAIFSRSVVSYAYGFTVVLFPLYLVEKGLGTLEVGLVIFGAMILSSLLGLISGMLADHYGRKYVLMGLLAAFGVCLAAFPLAQGPLILALLGGVGGFSSGATGGPIGSGSPLGAVQTAIIAEVSEPKRMAGLLSKAAVLEMISAMLGAFSLTALSLTRVGPASFFYLASALGVISLAVSVLIQDMKVRSPKLLPSLSYEKIFRLSLPTVPCGLGSGLIIPILSLWFKLRFGASTAAIGAVFGTMDLAMMGFMLLTPKMAATLGRLKVIVLTRFISSASFVAMAFSPIFPLAGAFLVLRGAFAMGGMPVRQSFVMLNVHDSERASANGATSFSRNTASSVGAATSGYVMRLGLESLPLLGGLIAMLDPFLYYAMFKEQWNERRPSIAAHASRRVQSRGGAGHGQGCYNAEFCFEDLLSWRYRAMPWPRWAFKSPEAGPVILPAHED